MFDLGKQKIEVKCDYGRKHSVTLQDVSNRKIIKCGCGVSIQLQDSNSSVKKSVSSVNKSIGDLEKMLKKLGK